MDVTKDRLYCDAKKSKSRLAAQTVMHQLVTTMSKLMAPVLSFTAEDIYSHIKSSNKAESIFMTNLPGHSNEDFDPRLESIFDSVLSLKGQAYKKIEEMRADKTISQSSECIVNLSLDSETFELLSPIAEELNNIFLVSSVTINKAAATEVTVEKTSAPKCERCWRFVPSVGKSSKHPGLCTRCESVVENI